MVKMTAAAVMMIVRAMMDTRRRLILLILAELVEREEELDAGCSSVASLTLYSSPILLFAKFQKISTLFLVCDLF